MAEAWHRAKRCWACSSSSGFRQTPDSGKWPDRVQRWVNSAGLPQLDAVPLRVGDPPEATDTFHVLDLVCHIRTLVSQL